MFRATMVFTIAWFLFSPLLAQDRADYLIFKASSQSFADEALHLEHQIAARFGTNGVISSIESADTGFKMTEGHRFHPNFALEGTLAWFGERKAVLTDADGKQHFYADTQFGIDVVGVGSYNIRSNLSLFAKAGIGHNWIESDLSSRTDIGESGEDRDGATLVLGAGVRLTLTTFIVDLVYERFELDSQDVDAITAGLGFHF